MTQLFEARELEGDSVEKGRVKRFKQIMRMTFFLFKGYFYCSNSLADLFTLCIYTGSNHCQQVFSEEGEKSASAHSSSVMRLIESITVIMGFAVPLSVETGCSALYSARISR